MPTINSAHDYCTTNGNVVKFRNRKCHKHFVVRNMNRFRKNKHWNDVYCYLVKFLKVFSIPYIILITVCILYIKYISVNKLVSRETSISSKKNVLILTAHPDDECMFFTPTILGLQEQGHRVYIVCLTKGNLSYTIWHCVFRTQQWLSARRSCR